MEYNRHDPGDLVRVTATFTNEDGVPTDPTDVTLTIRMPDGSTELQELGDLDHDSTGVYSFDIDTTSEDNALWGTWYYRFVGTGAVQQTSESAFYVRYSKVIGS